VLRQVDRAFAAVTWLVAAILVVMLLFGPTLVAHDQAKPAGYGESPSPYGGGTAVNAKALFVSNCGSCHTFRAAGTTGQVGPNLDQVSLTPVQVATQIRQGGGAMPPFGGRLSAAQIKAIAAFVASSH
jgi:mono/diheme cytochrome c family protein